MDWIVDNIINMKRSKIMAIMMEALLEVLVKQKS